jgi:hypothetical protein
LSSIAAQVFTRPTTGDLCSFVVLIISPTHNYKTIN